MPAVVSETAVVQSTSGRGWFRIGLLLLAIAVVPWAYRGWSASREEGRLRETAIDFFSQVAAGNKDAALRYLAGDYRRQVERDWKSDFDRVWHASDELSMRVMEVDRHDAIAEVRVSIARSGFTIQPLLHLRRIANGDWKITRIDHVDVDPRWLRFQAREAAEESKALADELSQKLDAE